MGKSSSRVSKKTVAPVLSAGMEYKGDAVIQRYQEKIGARIVLADMENKLGEYSSSNNTVRIAVSQIGKAGERDTVLHELAHAKDLSNIKADLSQIKGKMSYAQMQKVAIKGRYSSTPEFAKLYKKEGARIILERANRFSDTKFKNFEELKARVPRNYLSYMKTEKEVFADGYSQFITNAKAFKQYAPQTYNYFQIIKRL